MSIYPADSKTERIAKTYRKNGYAVIPLKLDGSKSPKESWDCHKWNWNRLSGCFTHNRAGIGILCGSRSAGLEVLDFENGKKVREGAWIYPDFENKVSADLLAKCLVVQTPTNGRHVWFRSVSPGKNEVLARDKAGGLLCETRAEGGMIVAPGSPPAVHGLNLPYRILSGNPLHLNLISTEERLILLSVAKSFNRFVPIQKAIEPRRKATGKGYRPGDRFNENAQWDEILCPAGWEVAKETGGVQYWTKPNGRYSDIHATTGYGQGDYFYCFSTDAAPFEPNEPYTKFACYALLYFGGDYKQAVKQIHNFNLRGFDDYNSKKENKECRTTANRDS